MNDSKEELGPYLSSAFTDRECFTTRAIWSDFIAGLTYAFDKEGIVKFSNHLFSIAGERYLTLLAIVEKIQAQTIKASDEHISTEYIADVFRDFDQWVELPIRQDYISDQAFEKSLSEWRNTITNTFVNKYKPETTTDYGPKVTQKDLLAGFGLMKGLHENPRSFSSITVVNAYQIRSESLKFLGLPSQ